MDPATIGLILSLAPNVLDLLFGEGFDPKLLSDDRLLKYIANNKKMVDRRMLAKGLEGYRFQYPKASAYRTKEGLSDEYFQKWAEAYAKNKLTAFSNSWIQFLKSKGFYDRMKKELASLSDEYHKVFPKKVKTVAEYKRIGPVIERQRKRVHRMEKVVELLQDPAIKEYARKLYDKWLEKKDKSEPCQLYRGLELCRSCAGMGLMTYRN
jgi:cytochrome c553